MSHFLILLGGALTLTPRLRDQIAGARVVAADSGVRHAAALGVTPELWVGDFDSSDAADLAAHATVPRDTFPAAKDVTDGEIAVRAALARGATTLTLAGAFGGSRPDHAFLHLTMGLRLAQEGVAVRLTSGVEEGAPLLPGHDHEFAYPPGTLFSVLAFSALDGLTLENARWPLRDRDVPFGSSLTLSNTISAPPLRVRLSAGRAMLLAYPASDP